MFQNRYEVANKLAQKLDHLRGHHPLVLGIPRGGVPMARIIADTLGGELDVVLVRKLGHPKNLEFAIGSVDEQGHVYADGLVDSEQVEAQLALLRSRRQRYTPANERVSPKGRVVILVDDGIATGWTLKAAITSLRSENPHQIVVAVGVAAGDSLREIRQIADEVICIDEPDNFSAVGQFYRDFSQVSDDEVIEALRGQNRPRKMADNG